MQKIKLNDRRTLPSKKSIEMFTSNLVYKLYPYAGRKHYYLFPEYRLYLELLALLRRVKGESPGEPGTSARKFIGSLPDIKERLDKDAAFICESDPAACSVDEVIMTYPGFYAILVYRLANILATTGVPLIPRVMTEFAHSQTGIDIHPKAEIGSPFFIDHGTGIVIGETAIIGNRVKLYQGVTIGALSVSKSYASTKRHPTIGDDVIIYAGSTILGGNTVIGHDSIIGGNVWLTDSVPAFSMVYHENVMKVRERKNNGL